MPLPIKKYRDLDLNFDAHVITGALTPLTEGSAVARSIRNLVLTNHYERPFKPDIGSNVQSFLFSPPTNITATLIRDSIERCITNFEPRAQLLGIKVALDANANAFVCTILFAVKSLTNPQEVVVFLKRSR